MAANTPPRIAPTFVSSSSSSSSLPPDGDVVRRVVVVVVAVAVLGGVMSGVVVGPAVVVSEMKIEKFYSPRNTSDLRKSAH